MTSSNNFAAPLSNKERKWVFYEAIISSRMTTKQSMDTNVQDDNKPQSSNRIDLKAKTQVIRAHKTSSFMLPHGVGELKISMNEVLKSNGDHKSCECTAKIICCSIENNKENQAGANKLKVKMISSENLLL